MSTNDINFKAAELSRRFEGACSNFDMLLESVKSQESSLLREQFHNDLKEYKQRGVLTVAFVGQYSAGKSTIISALTGRRDISIDSDISTDRTAIYNWNGIKVIDTPGLFTDRHEHDQITYTAISKADLLVFCLTHMLFDNYTVANFKKLAYELSYSWKIMLVINKMSASSGKRLQKIESYSHSLSEALKPCSLDEFPICFIDAKDYCDGIDENDAFLVEDSHFSSFIEALNRFVERRSYLVKFDTPVRITLSYVDKSLISFTRDSNEDTAFLEILTRLTHIIDSERKRLRTNANDILLELSMAIKEEGSHLAYLVGSESFEDANDNSSEKLKELYEETVKRLVQLLNQAIHSIHQAIDSELHSDLAQKIFTRTQYSKGKSENSWRVFGSFKNPNAKSPFDYMPFLDGMEKLIKCIGDAAIGAKGLEAGQMFLGAANVAGGGLHQGVYAVGKLLGFNFRPWQAVNIAKDLGNAARLVGPALGVVAVGVEIYSIQKEKEREARMAELRYRIINYFNKASIELSQEIESHLRDFEAQIYNKIEDYIDSSRKNYIQAISHSHMSLKELAGIRQDLEAIIKDI